MPTKLDGPRTWSMRRTREGYREYTLKSIVKAAKTDGPANVLQTPGLAQPGDIWQWNPFVVDPGPPEVIDYAEKDVWVWCRPDATVTIHDEREGDPAIWYAVEQVFSNEPPAKSGSGSRSPENPVENPLAEPYKISGGIAKFTEEGTHDRFGGRIVNSSYEQVRGPQNEWDASRPTVRIVQNVPLLQLDLLTQMIDTVNSIAMWGLPTRTIKFSNYSWEKVYYKNFLVYYTRTLEFEVMYRRMQGVGATVVPPAEEGDPETYEPIYAGGVVNWDRELLDEGTKCIKGRWETDPGNVDYRKYIVDTNADPTNPRSYVRFKDFNSENARVILDGLGRPWDPAEATTRTANWWVQSGSPAALTNQTWAFADATATAGGGTLYGPFKDVPTGPRGWPVTSNPFLRPGSIKVSKYGESDFRLLGVPVVLV